MELIIENIQEDIQVNDEITKSIENAINKVLEVEEISSEGEISISLVDEDEISSINSEFRNKNSITDVLSFPQYENLEEIRKQSYIVLGDIVICMKRAKEQSEEYGHSFIREISFLTVHSMYHLLGYDHDTSENTKAMRDKEEHILELLEIRRES